MAITISRIPARPILIQQWFPKERIPAVNALLTMGTGLVGGILIFLMGDLIEALDGWRNTFYMFGFLAIAGVLIWIILGRENPNSFVGTRSRVREPLPLKALLKYKTLWLLGIGVAGVMLSWGTMFTLFPEYAIGEGILTLNHSSYLLGLGMFGFMTGSIIFGFVSRRIGRRKPLLWIPGVLMLPLTMGILFSTSFNA